MSLSISHNYLRSMAQRYHGLRQRHERVVAKGEAVVAQVGKTVEVAGSAFLFGVANGKLGGVELLGVPVDLAAGVAGHLAGFMLASPKTAHHFHNLSDGALACFAARQGASIGQDWKTTGRLFGKGSSNVRGELDGGGNGGSMEDAELSRLARSL